MQTKVGVLSLALCVAAATGGARAAVTQDTFLLRDTGDLVELCSDAQTDSMYTAALNFCHGFAVGVFRVLREQDEAARRSPNPMFCVPNPAPTRNEAMAGFVQWAKVDPGRLALPPADGLATYLAEQYKCPRGR